MGLFLILPGAVVYAGFFSWVGDIFTEVTTIDKPVNSQTMALSASVGGIGGPDRSTGNDVNVTEGGALIPTGGPDGGLADLESEDNHGHISIYVVRSGDSYSSIAEMFDVSVNTILWANDLARGSKLSIGQTLIILPVSGVKHAVKKGDTLSSLAKKYKADADEIARFNGLDDGATLEIGSEVIVPDGEIVATQAAPRYVPVTSKVRNVGGPRFDGYYAAPLPAGYSSTQHLHGYNGIDLKLYRGAPVFAAAAGTVIIARGSGYNGGYGKYVVISHNNGTQTLYAHLDSVMVRVGEVVNQGQQIGQQGNTGRSTGSHLHFEVRGAKNPFDTCPVGTKCAL